MIEEVAEEEEEEKTELDKRRLIQRASMFSEAETFVSAPSSPQESLLSLYYSDTEEESNILETADNMFSITHNNFITVYKVSVQSKICYNNSSLL